MKTLIIACLCLLIAAHTSFGQILPPRDNMKIGVYADSGDIWLLVGVRETLVSGDTIGFSLNGINKDLFWVWEGDRVKLTKRAPVIMRIAPWELSYMKGAGLSHIIIKNVRYAISDKQQAKILAQAQYSFDKGGY